MSIGVHCDECGKTYQVSEKMAGRRGKCPKGHPIMVPAVVAAVEPLPEDNAFAFTSDTVTEAPPPAPRRTPAAGKLEPQPAPAVDEADEFAFSAPVAGAASTAEEKPRPKTGRHKAPARQAGAPAGKPSMMPLILGGILGVVGLGLGGTMFVMARSQSGPLKEQAEAAEKRANTAEEKARNAESAKLIAEAELDKLRKNPPKDAALERQLADARKKLADADRKPGPAKEAGGTEAAMAKEPDPDAPGGKNDPVMPSGRLAMDKKGKDMEKAAPKAKDDKPAAGARAGGGDGIPLGGDNWEVPGKLTLGKTEIKAGDRLWIRPVEDAPLKAVGGKLVVKFRWQLRKGKELPGALGVTIAVREANNIQTQTGGPINLKGDSGETEITFSDIKKFKGTLPITFYLSDAQTAETAYSSMNSMQAEFGEGKK